MIKSTLLETIPQLKTLQDNGHQIKIRLTDHDGNSDSNVDPILAYEYCPESFHLGWVGNITKNVYFKAYDPEKDNGRRNDICISLLKVPFIQNHQDAYLMTGILEATGKLRNDPVSFNKKTEFRPAITNDIWSGHLYLDFQKPPMSSSTVYSLQDYNENTRIIRYDYDDFHYSDMIEDDGI